MRYLFIPFLFFFEKKLPAKPSNVPVFIGCFLEGSNLERSGIAVEATFNLTVDSDFLFVLPRKKKFEFEIRLSFWLLPSCCDVCVAMFCFWFFLYDALFPMSAISNASQTKISSLPPFPFPQFFLAGEDPLSHPNRFFNRILLEPHEHRAIIATFLAWMIVGTGVFLDVKSAVFPSRNH